MQTDHFPVRSEDINLLKLIGEQRLNQMQQRFYNLTGFTNGCLDSEGNLLSVAGYPEPLCMNLIRNNPKGLKRCRKLVKACLKPGAEKINDIATCHAGMLDGRIPMRVDGKVIGFLVIGQLFESPPDEAESRAYARELGIDPDLYWAAARKIKVISREKLEAAAMMLKFMGSEIASLAAANRALQKENESRCRAEALLKESRDSYKALFETISDAIYVHDMDGRILDVNTVAYERLGYSRREIFNLSVADIDADYPSQDKMKAHLLKAAQDLPLTFESRHRTKADRIIDVELNLNMFSNTSGEKTCVAVARDITARKQMESQLRQARKMESIGTLAGGIAHDFNNILHMITANVELSMLKLDEQNPVYAYLDEVRTVGFRAADIVRQLLNFSRKSKQQLKTINLVAVLSETLTLTRSVIHNSVDIRHAFPDAAWMVFGDPIQLNQVMMNLCINASQVMESSGGTIRVSVTNIRLGETDAMQYINLPAGAYVRIVVSDTGPGIPEDIINRIFDPYFTTKPIGESSGMGLAVVHGIVTAHNGAVIAGNNPDGGARFTILLPTVSPSFAEMENI